MIQFQRYGHAGGHPNIPILILLLFIIPLATPAAATPVTWSLDNVSLRYGGLTGWFTYDPLVTDRTQQITDWSVTAFFGISTLPFSYVDPFMFDPADSMARAGSTLFFRSTLDSTQPRYMLLLTPTAPLIPPGPVTIVTVTGEGVIASYYGITPPTSNIPYADPAVGGYLTTTAPTVPEPSTLPLLASALVGLIGFRRMFKNI